jgi:hypothetical protein
MIVKSLEEAVKDIQAQCQVFQRIIDDVMNKANTVVRQHDTLEKWLGCKIPVDNDNIEGGNDERFDDDDEDALLLETSMKAKHLHESQVHNIEDNRVHEDTTLDEDNNEEHETFEGHTTKNTQDTRHNNDTTTSIEDKMLNSLHKILPLVLDTVMKKYCLKIMKGNKKFKRSIKPRVRRKVWDVYIGEDVAVSKCMCCEDIKITQHSYICGHVIADSKGGTQDVENLRPICAVCNEAMGEENMAEYKRAHFGTELR